MKEKIIYLLMYICLKCTLYLNKNKVKTDNHFRTYSGIKFNLLNPTPEMFKEEDFAKGIAYQAHYSGQSSKFFSIAEHCILTEREYKKKYPHDYIGRLAALIHDGQEGFYGDMIKPLKDLLPNYDYLEKKAQKALFDKYDIPWYKSKAIKWADMRAQDIEEFVFRNNIDPEGKIKYYNPERAYYKYIQLLNYLLKKIKENEWSDN